MTSNINSTICKAFDRDPLLSSSVLFRNSQAVKLSHEGIPRFGRTASMDHLIAAATPEKGGEYLLGLVTASICIFSFFLVWMVTLVLYKCLGHKKVGFYSGSRVRRPRPPPPLDPAATARERKSTGVAVGKGNQVVQLPSREEEEQKKDSDDSESGYRWEDDELTKEYNQRLREWEAEVKVNEKRLRRIRITVLISGVCIVVSALLMTTIGVNSLSKSLDNVREGLLQARKLSLEAVVLIQDFLNRQDSVLQATSTYARELNAFCPSNRIELCISLKPLKDCIFDDLPLNIKDDIREVILLARSYAYTEATSIQKDLLEIARLIDEYLRATDSFNWAFRDRFREGPTASW